MGDYMFMLENHLSAGQFRVVGCMRDLAAEALGHAGVEHQRLPAREGLHRHEGSEQRHRKQHEGRGPRTAGEFARSYCR